jgi:arylsulfatase A-like enzyme
MSGTSFLPLLKGQPFTGRKHIFAERGVHGNGSYTPETKANSFDQSRCVRSARWKLIYNCTPKQEYQPVDSVNSPSWKDIVAAHNAGNLKSEHEKAYFTNPRPVFELFDLDKDPGELNNLAGSPELREVEHELKVALAEKMMRDYDFLPLPIPSSQ